MIIKLQQNKSKRVQIVKVGKFSHVEYGKFSFTLADLQEMKANFDNNVAKQKIDGKPVVPFDYSHDDGEKAAGWITDLIIEKDENNIDSLFASVDWTPRGAEKISSKEFKFVSPAIQRRFKDNESGETHKIVLLGAALTNIPFLRDMEAVNLLSESKRRAFKSLFELSGDESGVIDNKRINMSLEDVKKGLKGLSPDERKEIFQSLSKDFESDLKKDKKELSEKLSQSDADLKLSLEKVKGFEAKLSGSEDLADRLKLSDAKVDDLGKTVKDLTKSLMDNDLKGKFDLMLTQGKVCEAQRKPFMDGDVLKMAELTQEIKLNTDGSNQKTEVDEAGDAEDKVLNLAYGKMKDDKGLSIKDAIGFVLEEKPELRLASGN